MLSLWLLLLVNCHEPPAPLTPEEIEVRVKGQPEVFLHEGDRVELEGLEGIYLGMPEAEALAVLRLRCARFVELKGGVMRESSTFKGCLTPNDPKTYAIRVGLTERADNRVFTLEVQRRHIELTVVRARFVQKFPDLRVDIPKRGVLTMEAGLYNLFADNDGGADGPTHILIGLSDAAVAKLNQNK